MIARSIEVANTNGLHLRVAATIAAVVRKAGVTARLFGHNEKKADGSSVLELVSLDAPRGTTVRVEIEGPDEHRVLARIEELFSDGAGI